jgi:RNA polymerase sigma-70 factor (family 1)
METDVEANITFLLQQLKEGSEPAFNAVYRLHSKILYSNILHLSKDAEIAKDLLQDLYLKIWEGRETIDPEKSFKSYLFTIARNMVYDYLRKVSLDQKARIRLMSNVFEFYTHIEEDLELKEKTKLLRGAVETLPLQCRRVYTLSKLDGKSHQEISEQLGVSISTVNNHMVRANKEVRAYLFRHGDIAIAFLVNAAIYHFK